MTQIRHAQNAIRFLSVALTLVFAVTTAQAAGFAKFDGVDGESKDKTHAKWTDITALSMTVQQPAGATGASRRRGTATFDAVRITKALDKSSLKLEEAVAKGKVFPKVELELTTATGGARVVYYRVVLTNAMVTSYQINASGGDAAPVEEIMVSFEQIKVTYMELDDRGRNKGNVEFEYKLEKGQ